MELDTPQDLRFIPEQQPKVAVAPLIDMVFLLICFYLLVGQMVSRQKDTQVELPQMQNPMIAAEMPAELVVNLRHDGSVLVDGAAVSDQQLTALLLEQMQQARDVGLRVVVRADRRQQFGRLDAVLKACRQAGLTQVVFRARE